MAADIAFYIGAPNVDGWYDVAAQNKDVEKIIAETGNLFKDVQKFDDSQAAAMGAWVDKNTNDGEMDILWLNGCMPNVLYPYPNVKPDGGRDQLRSGPARMGQDLFWAVDQVNAANPESPWKGRVWSFTVADFLIVDDFESYTDEEGVGARIYETWADGYADASSGSTVGYIDPPFCEQTIVHGGRQSMPLDYNDAGTLFFSEAKREWGTPQNWTVNGVDTLTLHLRGRSSNGEENLYVTLADSTGKSATVVHPDAAIAAVTQWTEWKIPLASFTGVNGAKVKSLIIGLGDKNASQAGGTGLLLIDNIWVTKP